MENTTIPGNKTGTPDNSNGTSFKDKLLLELDHLQHCLDNPVIRYLHIILVCVTILSTFFGNSLIIACYVKSKQFRGAPVYKLMLNVALSDLLLGISLLGFPVAEISPGILKYYTVCIIRSVLVTTSLITSILFLSLVSVDRFFAVIFPLKHLLDSKRTRRFLIMTLMMWTGCITCGFLLITQNKFIKYELDVPLRSCPITWVVDETYSALSALFMFTSITINSTLYVIVLKKIINRREITSNSVSAARMVSRTKLMMNVYVVFAVCWMPCLIFVFLVWLYPDDLDMKCYREHSITLGYVNSGLNWILYGIGNKNYRDEFRRLLCFPAASDDERHQSPPQNAGNLDTNSTSQNSSGTLGRY